MVFNLTYEMELCNEIFLVNTYISSNYEVNRKASCLIYLWFFKWTCFFLGLTKTFNEAERFAFQTMRNSASSSAGEEFH